MCYKVSRKGIYTGDERASSYETKRKGKEKNAEATTTLSDTT